MTEALSFLTPLQAVDGIRVEWIERLPNINVVADRDLAMKRLRPAHEARITSFAGPKTTWWRAEQVHGSQVSVVPTSDIALASDGLPVVPGVDGLITNTPGQVLGIYVADCGAIWLADTRTKAVGLLHSGKKGTQSNILGNAIDQMQLHFGTRPDDVIAVLSPCIRPPDYEIDFAAEIASQAKSCGIGHFTDCGLNTADDLTRFYSYRKELGKTGRMMAMIVRDA